MNKMYVCINRYGVCICIILHDEHDTFEQNTPNQCVNNVPFAFFCLSLQNQFDLFVCYFFLIKRDPNAFVYKTPFEVVGGPMGPRFDGCV